MSTFKFLFTRFLYSVIQRPFPFKQLDWLGSWWFSINEVIL